MNRKAFFLLLGPLLFVILYYLRFEGLSPEGQAVLACTVWVAVWWITEAVELEVAALLPLILMPLSGGLDIQSTTSSYGHPYIFLFMGGFMMGLAIERWHLHRRIAFTIISMVGTSEKRVLLGFMLATAFISMWISNTATAIMMLPIGLSVTSHFQGKAFARNLMLGIGYAASIGGMATLIGTPPNIIFAGVVKDSLGMEVSFLKWMLFATPFAFVLLLSVWWYLSRYRSEGEIGRDQVQLENIGKMTTQEKRVLIIFACVAFLWVTRSFLISRFIPAIDDTVIAVLGAVVMLIFPAGDGKGHLLDWNTAKRLPWGILLIFGAGLAIAKGFSSTDLASWLAGQFLLLKGIPFFIILLLVITGINFLTEITSNTATASMVLPLLITLAASLDVPPLVLMAGAVLAASCAFMLPVATPPNAVVFSSGKINIKEMVRTGIWINILSVALIYLFVRYWWPVIWG